MVLSRDKTAGCQPATSKKKVKALANQPNLRARILALSILFTVVCAIVLPASKPTTARAQGPFLPPFQASFVLPQPISAPSNSVVEVRYLATSSATVSADAVREYGWDGGSTFKPDSLPSGQAFALESMSSKSITSTAFVSETAVAKYTTLIATGKFNLAGQHARAFYSAEGFRITPQGQNPTTRATASLSIISAGSSSDLRITGGKPYTARLAVATLDKTAITGVEIDNPVNCLSGMPSGGIPGSAEPFRFVQTTDAFAAPITGTEPCDTYLVGHANMSDGSVLSFNFPIRVFPPAAAPWDLSLAVADGFHYVGDFVVYTAEAHPTGLVSPDLEYRALVALNSRFNEGQPFDIGVQHTSNIGPVGPQSNELTLQVQSRLFNSQNDWQTIATKTVEFEGRPKPILTARSYLPGVFQNIAVPTCPPQGTPGPVVCAKKTADNGAYPVPNR